GAGPHRRVRAGVSAGGGGRALSARHPRTAADLLQAWRARLLCPTASVRSERRAEPPDGAFPQELTQGVYRLGYNAKSSYGAHSFAIRRAAGNVMVDAPRFTGAVVAQLERWGGLSDILLTHRDDVGDAKRYG